MDKKRVRKYESRLKKSPKIEPHKYYKSDNNNNLKLVEANKVKLDGVTYETTLKLLQDKINETEQLHNTVKGALYRLTSLLNEYGYNTSNVELNALIGDILELNIIHPDKEYVGYKIVDGYVVGYGYDLIMEVNEQPDDFDKGYWEIIEGEWKLDNVRFTQTWGG